MDNSDYTIRERFAYFGRTVYVIQSLEKSLLNSLIFSYENITKTRYDELLTKKSQLTFGQLKDEIKRRDIFEDALIKQLEKFHETRDWLIHTYWWDRALEFSKEELRYKIVDELEPLTCEIMCLNEIINEINDHYLLKKGIDLNELFDDFIKEDKLPETPISRKLTKNETLIGLYLWEREGEFTIPVFKLQDNTFWTLCEHGLTFINESEFENEIIMLPKTKDIFPVNQFNPRPKISEEWNYVLDLKKDGLIMKVWSRVKNGKFSFEWMIKQHLKDNK